MRIKMPAVRIAQADTEITQQDLLTCGSCQKPFPLADIVKFIQHKIIICNKENYSLGYVTSGETCDDNSDDGGSSGPGHPLGVVNSRRPSISAPINSKKSSTPNQVRLVCSPPSTSPKIPEDEATTSTPKRRAGSSSPLASKDDAENHLSEDDIKPRIKQEMDGGSSPDDVKKIRGVDAESNTTHSEPSNYVCSTCKARLHSAWRLVQHVQHVHGVKIYVESSTSPVGSGKAGSGGSNNHSTSSTSSGCSSSNSLRDATAERLPHSGNGNGGATNLAGAPLMSLPGATRHTPHLPAPSPSMDPLLHSTFSVGGLLRMDASRPPSFPSATSASNPLNLTPNIFARPSHDHPFRMDQLVSEQFRLNQHHGLNLAAAAAAVAAVGGVPTPHSPFGPPGDRTSLPNANPSRTTPIPPPPPLSLALEPQLDFYSQRLRQLAGTTSPGAATIGGNSTPSPRKQILTPPFTSPSIVHPPQTGSANSVVSNNGSTSNSSISNNNNNSSNSNNNNNNNINTVSNNNNNNSNSSSSSSGSSSNGTSNNNNNNNNINNNNNVNNNNNEGTPPSDAIHCPRSVTPTDKPTEGTCRSPNSLVATPRSTGTPPGKSVNSDDTGSTEKVRSCEFCGKRFRFQSNLIVHRRTHTGEKPYKCLVCNHACTQSSKLKRHMKVHKNRGNGESGGEQSGAQNRGSSSSTPENVSNQSGSEEENSDADEDEEEEEEEEMDLEEEEEEINDDDDDINGDAPEDLTTKSTSSTPNNADPSQNNKISRTSQNNNLTARSTPSDNKTNPNSLVGELMDKFGLSNIQQYSEAYKQALQESVTNHRIRVKDDVMLHKSPIIGENNNMDKLPPGRYDKEMERFEKDREKVQKDRRNHLENGSVFEKSLMEKSAALRFREEFAKNLMSSQAPLDLGAHPLFRPGFDNPFDPANKRMKLELENHHMGRHGDRDSLYAGLWLPAFAAAHHRDMFHADNLDLLARTKGMENSILKANGPKPGPSAQSLAAAAAAALNLGIAPGATPPAHLKKESSRRNDTCEYCGKIFKNCSNLTVHRRSHTGEKPYKCELCSYACAQSSKLTRHMKTHGRLGKDVYRCRFCEMPFSVPSTLEKHMRKCVVSQNKNGGHIIPMINGDDDSVSSATKDNT